MDHLLHVPLLRILVRFLKILPREELLRLGFPFLFHSVFVRFAGIGQLGAKLSELMISLIFCQKRELDTD